MGRIFDVKNFSVNDGPGIRTTFFLKGCSLNCEWCHNPEGKSYENNYVINKQLCLYICNNCENVCKQGFKKNRILNNAKKSSVICNKCNLCSDNCPTKAIKVYGKEITRDEISKIIVEQYEIYIISKGGITFSGGEPFFQFDFLIDTCKHIKDNFKNINITIETSLCTQPENIIKICNFVDLFIVDFKCLEQKNSDQYVGLEIKEFFKNFDKLVELNKKICVYCKIKVPEIAK